MILRFVRTVCARAAVPTLFLASVITLVLLRGGAPTAATTFIGLIPVFLATGRGSDVMQPMAVPIVGGMAVNLLTVFIAPCIHCWVMERRVGRGETESAADAAGPVPASGE